ncbi:MAG: histidyl-tRNA synthetase [Parcubacteria group bacterium Gr01-1014_33]|nr:MAG: histidyl-tRNA synthetase [Parcubacteria group bacterium Gr01-1014_33]
MLQKKMPNRIRRIKPELPGGFRDYPPETAIAKQEMIDTIRKTFESFGFDPLETSSVQRTEVLTGGEEDSGKIIFNVKGSQDTESDSSLRFDLTVPLARFIAENPEIPKPFKRYEIGRVWRGERQQAGRYREFTQADIDIVGTSSLDADAEVVAVIYTTLNNLGVENFSIKINNRKILNALPELAGFPSQRLWEALRIIDKEDKIGTEGVIEEFKKVFSDDVAKQIQFFLKNMREEKSAGFTTLSKQKIVEEGDYEIQKVFAFIRGMKLKLEEGQKIFLDPALVRGLSYYTGTVFEAILTDAPEIGSVFGGGRYDDLVMQFTGQKIPAVGASLGVDRLLAALEKLDTLEKRKTTVEVLILNISENMKPEYLALAKELRDTKINTSLYLGEERAFQAQLAYAVKKEIPYVVIYGEKEKTRGVVAIKNLVTREQEEIARDLLVDYFKKRFSIPIVFRT